MAVHLTEEEQLESLKRWWSENGKSTVIVVVLAIGGYFGWEGYQANQTHLAEAASSHYRDLQDALAVAEGQILTEEKRATATHLANTLKEEHQSNLYSSQAALFLAKMAVESNQLSSAAAELQWVVDQNVDAALVNLTRNRLARVLIAEQKYDEALLAVTVKNAGSFESLFAETRGDIHLLQGDTQQARAAYQLAQQSIAANDRARAPLLAMKMDELKTPEVTSADPEVIAEPQAEVAGE